MKTILLPTDFSENAFAAIKYAVDFHKDTPRRFVVLHSYELPIGASDAFISIDDMTKSISKNEMAELLKRIKKIQPDTPHKYETHITYGSPIKRIMTFVKRKNASLIFMGTKGASGVKKVIIGSNASALLRSSHCPVIVIPDGYSFKTPQKIGLASDLKPLSDIDIIQPLIKIIDQFDSKLLVFYSGSGGMMDLSAAKKSEADVLKNQFVSIQDSYHFDENKNALAGINQFIEEQSIDLIAMVTRKSGLFKMLFHQSTVEQVVFETQIPLLAIHN